MAVKIRLTRMGDKKRPFYRVVVTDSRQARDGKYIELLGTYNPLVEKDSIVIDAELTKKWIANGAQMTDTAKAVLVKAGAIKATKYVAKANAKPATPKAAKKGDKK